MINYKKYYILASIGIFLLFSAGCRSARYLGEDQYLVVKTEIEGIPTALDEEAEAYIQQDIRPNSRLNLFLYNFANTKSGQYRTTNIRKIGEPPRILDSALIDLTRTQIARFLFNKGYFQAQIEDLVQFKNKRAEITFQIDPGQPFRINQVFVHIDDPAVATLYLKNSPQFTKLNTGARFDADSLAAVREEVYLLMRQHGYYDFLRQNMYVDVDTNAIRHLANLNLHIENPPGVSRHIKYEIDSSFVVIKDIDPSRNNDEPRIHNLDGGVQVSDFTRKFRPQAISRYLFMRQQHPYNQELENMTYDRLYDLNSFRSIRINFEKRDSNHLQVHYELIPRAYMANQIEGEYTFSAGMGGFNLGNTFSHRNLFGGAEQLDLQLRYGVLFDSRLPGNLFERVFNNDFQIGINITVPRLITPFRTRDVNKFSVPRTIFTSNLQVFDQQETYSNRYFVNTLTYQWLEAPNKQHQLSPLVLEYRRGQLNNSFAQDLIDQGYLLYVRSNNRAYFGLGSQYSYTYNAPLLIGMDQFFYFRGHVELSGNLLNLAANLIRFEENIDGEKALFGVPFLQYTKIETDIRHYRYLGGERQLIFRFNPGIAIPYGNNSSLLIFEKSFFGGGMNGIRAWQARTLGPGNYNRRVLNPSLRPNFRNLDQLGELKLEGNIEYRFKILNNLWGAKIKGATFMDIGNIWRISDNELNPGGTFDASKFLGQLAIGTGAGIRLDLDYFIIRLDVGLKVKDPQFLGSDQWVITEFFNSRTFKNNFALTNAPDKYRFLQYNFGIGLPF